MEKIHSHTNVERSNIFNTFYRFSLRCSVSMTVSWGDVSSALTKPKIRVADGVKHDNDSGGK